MYYEGTVCFVDEMVLLCRTTGEALLALTGRAAGRDCIVAGRGSNIVGRGCTVTGRGCTATGRCCGCLISSVGLIEAAVITGLDAGAASFFTGSGICGTAGFAICSA